jgi:hypothetical protein
MTKQYVIGKVTKSFGLPVVVRRNSFDIYCGYVGVPQSHPCHGIELGDSELGRIEIHGGVSYAAGRLPWLRPEDSPGIWWLGFDCATEDDGILGVDDSGCVYRDEEFAQDQALLLARRLAGLHAEVN